MPVAHVCFMQPHSLYMVLHVMLNLLAMSMTTPLWRWSSVAIITSTEITSNHLLFERSFFFTYVGDASLSEASRDSIIHSNRHTKL